MSSSSDRPQGPRLVYVDNLRALTIGLERQLLWGLVPERHMLAADWSNHALPFVAYVYGCILAGGTWLGADIDAQWRYALGIGVGMSVAMVVGTWIGFIPGRIPPPYTGRYLLFWTVYAVGAWAWMVAALGVARRWLTHDTPPLRYAHTMSYVWYLVHQPIIIDAAYVVVRCETGVPQKLAALLAISLPATLVLSELLRHVPVLGRALGGAAQRPARARSRRAHTPQAASRRDRWTSRPSGRS